MSKKTAANTTHTLETRPINDARNKVKCPCCNRWRNEIEVHQLPTDIATKAGFAWACSGTLMTWVSATSGDFADDDISTLTENEA